MVGLTLLNADVTEGWKRGCHAPERVRAGMSALSQSLDVEPALHAFDEDDAAPRRAQRSAFNARYSSESYQRRACSMFENSVTTIRLGFQSPSRVCTWRLARGTCAVPRDGSRDLLPILLEPLLDSVPRYRR